MTAVLVSAGDASGDAHAAELVGALRKARPDLVCFGLGGPRLAEAGVAIEVPLAEVAVGGFVEVLGAVPRVLSAWRRLLRAARDRRPALAILVDAPDLHIPLARRLRGAGVPILYYVAPQVWAWRTGRIRKLARRVDRMAVIFPFEVDAFAQSGLRADFVGHPLVDPLRRARARVDRAAAREALGVADGEPLVLLLPGSRHNELRHGLPLHLATAEALRRRVPAARFALALAPTIDRASVERAIAACAAPVRVVEGATHEAMIAADAALVKPGTAALELALLGCPHVAAARVHPLTAALARRLVRIPAWTLPNLIAGAPIVPEFLQDQAKPERIAEALAELLAGPARERQLARLADVARRLGEGGAAERAAAIALEMIDGARAH